VIEMATGKPPFIEVCLFNHSFVPCLYTIYIILFYILGMYLFKIYEIWTFTYRNIFIVSGNENIDLHQSDDV
jgi:hypothetical protein